MTKRKKIERYLSKGIKPGTIISMGYAASQVYRISKDLKGTTESRGALKTGASQETKQWTDSPPLPKTDVVNHPAHYKTGGIETIDFIEAKQLGYNLGNCVKYISRAGVKTNDALEDLKKARWYLNREIENREKQG